MSTVGAERDPFAELGAELAEVREWCQMIAREAASSRPDAARLRRLSAGRDLCWESARELLAETSAILDEAGL